MPVYAIVNHKGGVGKTVTSTNFAVAAANSGRRVVLVDADPQGSASSLMSVSEHSLTLYDALQEGCDIREIIRRTRVQGLSLIAADERLSDLFAVETANMTKALRKLCRTLPETDMVVIDCGPSLSSLTSAVIIASDEIIIPTTFGKFALDGIIKTIHSVKVARKTAEQTISINGVLLTKAAKLSRFSKYHRALRQELGALMYAEAIPESKPIAKAEFLQRTLLEHAPKASASLSYEALFNEAYRRYQLRRK